MVQRMMNEGQIEFYHEITPTAESINMIGDETTKPLYGRNRPLILYGKPSSKVSSLTPTPKLVVEVPKPFPYKSNKAIPWKYKNQVVMIRELTPSTATMELSGVSHLTRSGRCYALPTQKK